MLELRRAALAILLTSCLSAAGCAWLGGGHEDVEPEKLNADKPCPTECCCKTTQGYYAYFRCQDRVDCAKAGGSCERPDLARCAD
jgi:hypothetical protein